MYIRRICIILYVYIIVSFIIKMYGNIDWQISVSEFMKYKNA